MKITVAGAPQLSPEEQAQYAAEFDVFVHKSNRFLMAASVVVAAAQLYMPATETTADPAVVAAFADGDNYLTYPEPVVDKQYTDTCAVDTPSFGAFSPVATSELVGQATSTQELFGIIEDTYSVPISVLDTPIDLPKSNLNLAPIDLEGNGTASRVARSTEKLAEALSDFDPRVIAAIGLKGIVFVGEISGKESTNEFGGTVGLYRWASENRYIYLNYKAIGIDDVAAHELEHAISDTLLCDPTTEDFYDDSVISSLTPDGYRSDLSDESPLVSPDQERTFASNYGATSAAEDRAEILSTTLYQRGLVQPGDADWGSPFHMKQQELVRRMDALTPGYAAYLQELTLDMRPHVEALIPPELLADMPKNRVRSIGLVATTAL